MLVDFVIKCCVYACLGAKRPSADNYTIVFSVELTADVRIHLRNHIQRLTLFSRVDPLSPREGAKTGELITFAGVLACSET